LRFFNLRRDNLCSTSILVRFRMVVEGILCSRCGDAFSFLNEVRGVDELTFWNISVFGEYRNRTIRICWA
jgi:hypothetical protein